MIVYIYDGTFSGLLTAVYEAFYQKEKPGQILKEWDYSQNLFSQPIYIYSDNDKADKVFNAIKERISFTALKNVYYAFLSETDNGDTLIYNYLKLGLKMGKYVDGNYSHETVSRLHEICKKVAREKHRMLGLIRFRLIRGDVYYASMEPDHNVIALIAPHFARRMSDQNWIIHDIKRKTAIVYNQTEWVMTELEVTQALPIDEEEYLYQKVWKTYFDKIAIRERKNPRLQKSFMPSRYWKHLIEI
ncbi:TIGR03915 family putative DNA repair protein [Desulfitibacter alkalitolerans]|uniref:TIGR03915 family putative DNA repair protein n=1 Tax=Desulfitibacter alkalitolerans TaxID=264641 RepID=UPI000484B35A|nr:TIGR03915 family putative DNA repair protein [Desulfitibacter alkalitolerans]